MFEKIRKMKNQKGFTLVELIVVLVILAILAAMLVPALTGYIDKANRQKIVAATRQVVMAAQTQVSEKYASKTLETTTITIADTKAPTYKNAAGSAGKDTVAGEEIVALAEVATVDSSKNCTFKNGISNIDITYNDKGHVTSVVLTQGSKTCTYTEGKANGTDGAYNVP